MNRDNRPSQLHIPPDGRDNFKELKQYWEAISPDTPGSADSATSHQNLLRQKSPFLFPSATIEAEHKEEKKKIEVTPLKFARSVAPLCNNQLNQDMHLKNKQEEGLVNQTAVFATRVIWKSISTNENEEGVCSKAAHRMAPASFWNSTPTPCSPTHCSFQRNSNLRATVHVLPSSRHEEKKSKKAASMDNVKKSVFSRNSRLTASTGLGKQYRKLSDGLISSKGEFNGESSETGCAKRKSNFRLGSFRKKMSKEHSGNQKLDYPKVTIEENCLEEEPAVNFVPAEDQITDLLSPLDCDYLTTDDSRLKRRSRSFSKADVHIFERRQEAMQKKEKLFREVDFERRRSVEPCCSASKKSIFQKASGLLDRFGHYRF